MFSSSSHHPPLAEWAWTVTEHHLAKALPGRWAHVRSVAFVAAQVAAYLGEDQVGPDGEDLLIAASLLHDIGYAPALTETGYHPLDGARFVMRQGGHYRLACLVANHSAAVFAAELRGFGHELAAFPDEPSAVRDALWYSDMRVSPLGAPVSFDERIAEIRNRHGPGSYVVRALAAGGLAARRAAVRRTEARMLVGVGDKPSL